MKIVALVMTSMMALTAATDANAALVTATYESPQYLPSNRTSGFSFQITFDPLGTTTNGSLVAFGGPTVNPVFSQPVVFTSTYTTRCFPQRGPMPCLPAPITRIVVGGATLGAETLGDNDFSLAFDIDGPTNPIGFAAPVINFPNLLVTTTSNGVTTSTPDVLLLKSWETVAAVPEPASWAMMIGGFGVVGGTMRRRKRKVTARVQFA